MKVSKITYIQNSIDHDYMVKATNAAQGFLYMALICFALNLYIAGPNLYLDSFLIICSVIVAVVRILMAKKYLTELHRVEFYTKLNSFCVIINSLFWSFIIIRLIGDKYELKIPLYVTIFILVSACAISPVNLSHKKWVQFAFNIIILLPAVYIAFQEYKTSQEIHIPWIIAFGFFALIYYNKQGVLIRHDMINRFALEYDLKASNKALQRNREELEEETLKTFHASRLSSLGEMAGGIAHEVNNPLMVITGHISMLKKNFASNPGLYEDSLLRLEKMSKAASKIHSIVKGMKLITSNQDEAEIEEIDLNLVLEQSLVLYEERIKLQNIDFKIDNHSKNIILANPVHVSQIIINLLSNALDAVKSQDSKKLTISIEDNLETNNVLIKVINNGPLIDTTISTKIFEPFFTTKALHEGTGLGLSISKGLARKNGGDLYYSEVDNMVCFNLKLKLKAV